MRNFTSSSIDLNGNSVLVTGGTGSFGKRFVNTILDRFEPRKIIVFSRDELKQSEMAADLTRRGVAPTRFFIGDVRDVDRLELAMREVDYVVHAAALKQVPAAEYNPFECIRTNVHGAENVVTAALRTGVRKVIALSTDKAANPINLYGASKLASDKIFVAANNLSGTQDTHFSVVRYGNVIGSRGSVVDVFQRLIDEGSETLPITDSRMTRFWITLQQGVDFVLSSLEMMRGGEIYVPRIPSLKIVDLARFMAPQLAQKEIGIRPGEKLHEIMITADDARSTMALEDRFIIEPSLAFWSHKPFRSEDAHSVEDGFQYSSNTNNEWLSEQDWRNFVAEQQA